MIDIPPLNFDVAGSQVHRYESGDVPATRRLLAALLAKSLLEIDRTKGFQIQKAIDQLDGDAMTYIAQFGAT